jgi:hypothetical protein
VRRAARVVILLGIAALAVALLPPATALAKGPLLRGLEEDLHRSSDATVRGTWFDRTVEAGARIVRIGVAWRFVSPTRPANPGNPADPAYDFGEIDRMVSDARSRGLAVMLSVSNAPDWAQGPGAPAGVKPGTWKPDPAAFGGFAEALGRRYSGQYSEAPGAPLPEVEYFEVWNEPNLPAYLAPQWEGDRAEAPRHYRLLLNAFYDGVKVGNPLARVVAGATSPYGDSEKSRESRMRPLRFLRELLCLKRRGTMNCPTKPKLDILSHHPINLSGGPQDSARHRDDASTGDFDEVRGLLKRAERENTVLPQGTGRRPAWASEVWWLSDPPGGFASVSVRAQAQRVQLSLYELWRQGAAAVFYYQLVDDASAEGAERAAGLYFADGRRKPAFTAYRFPLVVEPQKQRHRAWTISPASGELEIQVRRGGDWRPEKSLQVVEGVPETTKLRVSAKDRVRAAIAGETSLASRAGR